MHRLKGMGFSNRMIAGTLGLDRATVSKYIKEPDILPQNNVQRSSKLDPYRLIIKEMVEQYPKIKAPVVLRHIKERGFEGEVTIVRDYLRTLKRDATTRQAFIRFESDAGQQMQIDWGHFGSLIYGGTSRKLYALAVIESHSRMLHVSFTHMPSLVNLANLSRDFGDHPESRRLYASLQEQHPDNPVIRRNALVSLEYDSAATDEERFNLARAWGEWAVVRAGGAKVRPVLRPIKARQLRIGYVSPDFCQHTVGLFVKDVLKAHDPGRVAVFAYSAGMVSDWVTNQIRAASTFRDVRSLDDVALARLISEDGIDILVDLSGHTAGSRLTVFAHRPAPVQVSWLGYFATTGLACMDAVLLDQWHAVIRIYSSYLKSLTILKPSIIV